MIAEYKVNDHVKYGTSGVCEIESITKMSLAGAPEKDFYILKPLANPASKVYVPLDNEALLSKMRPLLTEAEIKDMIGRTKEDPVCWIDEKKPRSEHFRGIIKSGSQLELLRLVSCIYLKSRELSSCGKRLSSMDEGILKMAERLVEDEFSHVLGISTSQVGNFIRDELNLL